MIKIDPYDIKCVHGSFYEKSDNQIDILENLRSAVTQLSNLADFKGAAADSVKNYMVDVHTQIINSFETLLMEMEVKLLMLYQDFNSSVDLSENSVVCDDYLNEVIYDMNEIIKPSHYYSTYTGSVLKSINDIIYLKAPQWDEFIEQIKSAKAVAESTLEQLVNFENRHINDMDNINDTLSKIESACLYIYNTKNITNYKADSVCENEWYEELSKCQLNSYLYAAATDPDFQKTRYTALIGKMDIAKFVELFQNLLKDLIGYSDNVIGTDTIIISLLNLSNDQDVKNLIQALKNRDEKSIDILIQGLTENKHCADGINNVTSAEWLLYILAIGINVLDSYYDERTGSFSEFDTTEFIAGSTIDTASFLLPISIGAIIGTPVGLVAGIFISLLGIMPLPGTEPPKTFIGMVTDNLENVVGDVGNWFSKVFW